MRTPIHPTSFLNVGKSFKAMTGASEAEAPWGGFGGWETMSFFHEMQLFLNVSWCVFEPWLKMFANMKVCEWFDRLSSKWSTLHHNLVISTQSGCMEQLGIRWLPVAAVGVPQCQYSQMFFHKSAVDFPVGISCGSEMSVGRSGYQHDHDQHPADRRSFEGVRCSRDA